MLLVSVTSIGAGIAPSLSFIIVLSESTVIALAEAGANTTRSLAPCGMGVIRPLRLGETNLLSRTYSEYETPYAIPFHHT